MALSPYCRALRKRLRSGDTAQTLAKGIENYPKRKPSWPPAIAFVFDQECLTRAQKDDLRGMDQATFTSAT